MPTLLDVNTSWAHLLIDRLVAAGVERAVISPGARSTPFVLAAAQHPGLAVHTIVDERSAAFFALGQARATGRPSLLICTSGTAGAHYFPALVEASQSGIPLLVLTADRPPELHHRGAAQTIDQSKLFGGFVRRFFELGAPDADPRALAGLSATAALAVAASRAPSPGPVHLNAWLRKPLEPLPAADPVDAELSARVAALTARPAPRRYPPRRAPDPAALAELAALCRSTRGLIVCGPLPPSAAALAPLVDAIAAATGWPVLAEATSQLRFRAASPPEVVRCDFFDALLHSPAFRAAARPGAVLQIGGAPVSRSFEVLLEENPRAPRWIVTDHGWPDPFNQTAAVLAGDLALTLDALASALAARPAPPQASWNDLWRAHAAAAAAAVAELLADAKFSRSEAVALSAALSAAAPGAALALSNSLPVREVDWFCPGDRGPFEVLHQRGANGIDGMVSGAAGAASVLSRPVLLLCGDLAFLHDAGGLAAVREAAAPLTMVVLDNGGGRLFELQPLAEQPERRAVFERCFVAPRLIDHGALARAFGLEFARTRTPEELSAALAAAPAHARGARVVVAEVDGALTRPLQRRLRELVEQRAPRAASP